MTDNIISFKNQPTTDLTWLKNAIMGEEDILNFFGGIQYVNSNMALAGSEEKQPLYEYHRAVLDEVCNDPEQLKLLHSTVLNMDDYVDEQRVNGKMGYVCGALNITYQGEKKGLHLIQFGFIRFIRAITDPIPTEQA